MTDQILARRTVSNLTLFYAVYVFFLFCKLYLYTPQQSVGLYEAAFLLNTVELLLWVGIGRRYYSFNSIGAGVVILYTCMSFYVIIPLALLAYGVDIFPFAPEVIKISMLGQSIALTHIFLFFHLLITPSRIRRTNVLLMSWFQQCKPTHVGTFIVALFGLIIALIYYYNFISSGVASLVGFESRTVIARTAETGKTWLLQYIFFAWLMAITAIYLLKNKLLALRFETLIVISAVLLFLYVYLTIGNRRELALFLIFSLLLSVGFKKKAYTLFVIAALPALLGLGLLRALSGSSLGDFDLTTNLLNLFGEFVFPHYALQYYASLPNFQFQLGESFILLPGYALPSFGMWDKSNSLSVQFAFDFANLDMGYALTPLAEGYINFGWLAVVITPLLITLTLLLVMRFAGIVPFVTPILFSFSLDISRGEFTTISFQLLIFSFIFYLVTKMIQIGIPKGNK